MPEIITLEKKGGLSKLRSVGKSGSPISPKLFTQKVKDPNDKGEFAGDYRGNTLPDSRHFLAPYWDHNQWAWGSTPEKFNELFLKLELSYWKGHLKEGQPIPHRDFSMRVKSRNDDVFMHPIFYGKFYMENGHINLNVDDPVKEFLAYCYKGFKSKVDDKTSGNSANKYITAGTTYQLKTSKFETTSKVKTTDKEVEAITWVGKLKQDEDRLRAICEIMGLSGYSRDTSAEGAYLLLADSAKSINKLQKYDQKSPQDRFLELVSEKSENLDLIRNILIAKDKGFIRLIKNKGMMVDGELISGAFNEKKMIDFMLDPKNQHLYSKLIQFVENA